MNPPLWILLGLQATVRGSRRLGKKAKNAVSTPVVAIFVVLFFVMSAVSPVVPGSLFSQSSPTASAQQEENICPDGAPLRSFDVHAVAVPIVYNNFGMHDPHGRMYVLEENKDELLAQVDENGLERPSPLVQPLTIRAHVGDCVEITLTNDLPGLDPDEFDDDFNEPVSMHIHGVVADPGQGMNLGNNEDHLVARGESDTFRVWIPDGEENAHDGNTMEGARFFHSHADARLQTRLGLFGSLVAEPKGSVWLDPADAITPLASGQAAIIQQPEKNDFREFAHYYHDDVMPRDKDGDTLPIVSPHGEYGPGTKALNYRSEPFMQRFDLVDERHAEGDPVRTHDKSQGYGSYTNGDPGTFIPESYVGEPTKFRLMNAGPNQPHVHHLHGGGIRWRASPVADELGSQNTIAREGPVKTAEEVRSQSERLDVQNIAPGESFNLEPEGGAGGVQRTVGDLLFHCHIVEHYLGGMWSFWRVWDTTQPHLAPLPDMVDDGLAPPARVNSIGLLGKTFDPGFGEITEANIDDWIRPQLPAQGVPVDDGDASAWDWVVEQNGEGPLYLGEHETEHVWENYDPGDNAGERYEIEFNEDNGRPAYPLLRPHLGKRPPFAPDHGPTPYLGEEASQDRPDGLCPPDARKLEYQMVALATDVRYHDDFVDTNGMIYVHADQKDAVLAGDIDPKSMILRANQGDCVDVILTNQLEEEDPTKTDKQSKVNMHIHLVQFDIQASDGVITGKAFEQSVRPAHTTGTSLLASAGPGDTKIKVDDTSQLQVGRFIGIGLTEANVELRNITSISGNFAFLDSPLDNDHQAGERVGTEFVRYRWYPDVDLGMVYWHDHVDGLVGWKHGLFGGLVVNPADSRWVDPKREIADPTQNPDEPSLHMVDIVNEEEPANKELSYREYVVQFQDRAGGSELAAFNLRAEPLFTRGNQLNPLASEESDPGTDVWEAYPDDPVMVRFLYAGQTTSTGVGTFAIPGHRFPFEQHLPDSRTMDTLSAGISSQHNLRMEDCGAGGCQAIPGDYLYYMTNPALFEQGAWGVFRVHDAVNDELNTIPSNPEPQPGALPTGPPDREHEIVALRADADFNEREGTRDRVFMFAPAEDEDAIENDELNPEPLVLRALPDEVIDVTITNRIGEAITLHAGMVASDPQDSYGIPVGDNPTQAIHIEPDETKTFRWLADREGVGHISSFGVPGENRLEHLYGAIVVEPEGSTFDNDHGTNAVVTLADGTQWDENVLFYWNDEPRFESSIMPYTHLPRDADYTAINYRTEQFEERLDRRPRPDEFTNPDAYSSTAFGEPETPILSATEGNGVLIRAIGGDGDQLQLHSVAGHWWKQDPDMEFSNIVDFGILGPRQTSDAWIEDAGQGGAGDYLYATHRIPFSEVGGWGILRVEPDV